MDSPIVLCSNTLVSHLNPLCTPYFTHEQYHPVLHTLQSTVQALGETLERRKDDSNASNASRTTSRKRQAFLQGNIVCPRTTSGPRDQTARPRPRPQALAGSIRLGGRCPVHYVVSTLFSKYSVGQYIRQNKIFYSFTTFLASVFEFNVSTVCR